MAINKTVNKSTKSHGAMRNCLEYVLREGKTNESLTYINGPFDGDKIDYDNVYHAFLEEKKLWNKDSGRMYVHNIISWHKEETITLEQALEFVKEFVDKWFDGFQSLVAVHQDRDHIHCHIVTNSVSYENGHKAHASKHDLERMKQLTNVMCIEKGFTVPEKGKDFYGKVLEEGYVRAWSKDKYHLLQNETKQSYVAECAMAVSDSINKCEKKEDFIRGMNGRGWHVTWSDTRKHITFENDEGKKVRDTNLSKSFNLDISKEVLFNEFERQNTKRTERNKRLKVNRDREAVEIERYYTEVNAAVRGTIGGTEISDGAKGQVVAGRKGRGPGEDTEAFIDNIRTQVGNAETGRKEREVEQCRRNLEAEQKAENAERKAGEERALHKKKSRSHDLSR